MLRHKFPLAIVAYLLLPAVASAASVLKKRHIYHWRGYGFLPGYHQPPNNSVPIYASKGSHPRRWIAWVALNIRTAGLAGHGSGDLVLISVKAKATVFAAIMDRGASLELLKHARCSGRGRRSLLPAR
jgi:hypothetical protein